MNDTPKGWPRISSAIYYDDPRAAIAWLSKALGFEVRILVEGEDGGVAHSELVLGGGVIMVSAATKSSRPEWAYRKSPRGADGINTQSMMIYVDDVDAHATRAREAGAKIVSEPKTSDYGEGYWVDRSCEIEDLEGHHWWLCQRLRDR